MNGFEMILPFLKPIEHLILDDSISEVMVNGPDRVFIEKQGFLQQVPGVSIGEKSLMVAVKNIARRLGDDISESKPILDSRLPDGSRVAAIIPPCSLGGVTLTIRKFNTRHFEMEDLIRDRDSGPRPREPPRRLRPRPQEHPHQRWHGYRKNYPLSDPRKIHSTRGAHPRDRRHGRDSTGAGKPRPV